MPTFPDIPRDPKKPGNWTGIQAWREANPEKAAQAQINGGRAAGRARQARFELVAECRKLGPSALKALQAALTGKNMALRIEAASILLDRGFGKAAQLVEYAGEVEFRLSSLDDETLEGLIRDRIRGLGLSQARSGQPASALPPVVSPASQPDSPSDPILPTVADREVTDAT